MERHFNFGKVDFNGTGRKINLQTVEVRLKDTDKGPCFSASANVWNARHTDIIAGGQCLDYLKSNSKVFKEIKRLWELYHLNDLNAGTVEQDKAIADSKVDGTWTKYQLKLNKEKAAVYPYSKPTASHYEVACEVLKEKGMYEVKLEDGTDYKYGHGWLYRAIPENDLKKIRLLLDSSKTLAELEELI